MSQSSKAITVGLEFEAVKATPALARAKDRWGFTTHFDASITDNAGLTLPRSGPSAGVEIVSKPIVVPVSLNGDGSNLRVTDTELRQQVAAMVESIHHVNKSCGIHVHLGRPSKASPTVSEWGPEHVRTMLIVGNMLEPTMMELVHPSRRDNKHCRSLKEVYGQKDWGNYYPVGTVDPVKYNNTKRYAWLNAIETVRKGTRSEPGYGASQAIGTIEIRLLGETNYEPYIQSWVRYWVKVAALVAYTPAAMAISRICLSNTLAADIVELRALQKVCMPGQKVSEPGPKARVPAPHREIVEDEDYVSPTSRPIRATRGRSRGPAQEVANDDPTTPGLTWDSVPTTHMGSAGHAPTNASAESTGGQVQDASNFVPDNGPGGSYPFIRDMNRAASMIEAAQQAAAREVPDEPRTIDRNIDLAEAQAMVESIGTQPLPGPTGHIVYLDTGHPLIEPEPTPPSANVPELTVPSDSELATRPTSGLSRLLSPEVGRVARRVQEALGIPPGPGGVASSERASNVLNEILRAREGADGFDVIDSTVSDLMAISRPARRPRTARARQAANQPDQSTTGSTT